MSTDKNEASRELCYTCSGHVDSKEHVPPKSFFPSGHRSDLVKVPSCRAHNHELGEDQEYLRLFLTYSAKRNDVGGALASGAVRRGLLRPHKFKWREEMRKSAVPVTILERGILVPTGAVEAKIDRINSALTGIGRGLYYNAFTKPSPPTCHVHVLFLTHPDVLMGLMHVEMVQRFPVWFQHSPRNGAHPSVFWWQMTTETSKVLFRMCFYGGLEALVVFDEQSMPDST